MIRILDGHHSSKVVIDPPLTPKQEYLLLDCFEGRIGSVWYDRTTGRLLAFEVPLLDAFLFQVEVARRLEAQSE